MPLATSFMVKKTLPPETVNAKGRPATATVDCLRKVAFPAVPSLDHSPTWVPLRAKKYRRPSAAAMLSGALEFAPG
jgi:hypothetical protein